MIGPVLQINVGKIDHLVNIVGKTGLLHGEIGTCIHFIPCTKINLDGLKSLGQNIKLSRQ